MCVCPYIHVYLDTCIHIYMRKQESEKWVFNGPCPMSQWKLHGEKGYFDHHCIPRA